MTGPVSVSGYVRSGNLVHMVAAAPVLFNETQARRAEMAGAEVLMVSLELDEAFLERSAMSAAFPGLEITFDDVPDGDLAVPLFGLEGNVVARLVWPAPRPGDSLLRPLSPALALGLVAIGYFLYLFVRGADLFMERQALLATALQHEQALRNLKFRFVSMVTHELRTPLAAIRSATELLERYGERMSDEDRAEEHSAIHRSVDTLSRLVDNVVIMGKSDWLESKSPPQEVDLVALCEQIWEELTRGQDAPHDLVVRREGPKRPFRADPAYVRALLSNLLQNAIKYSPGREKIIVELVQSAHSLTIRVTDFGIGIPQDEIDGIFEPFRRAKNTEAMSGSGLGLAIVRASAQALGGTTKVRSELGKGTTFEVVFPEDWEE
jgi:signal transduction histidine kinase